MEKYNKKSFLTLIAFILKETKEFFWGYIAFFVISSIWAIDQVLRPYLIKLIINSLEKKEEAIALSILIGVYLCLSLFIILVFRAYDILCIWMYPRLRQHIILRLTDHAISKPIDYLQNHSPGEITSKIQTIASSFVEIPRIVIDEFYARCLSMVAISYTLFVVHTTIGLLFLAWITIFFVYAYFTNDKGRFLSDIASSKISEVMGKITDTLHNHSIVKIFSREREEHQNTILWTNQLLRIERLRERFYMKIWTFQGAAFFIIQGISCFILIKSYQKGDVTPGDFVLVITLNIATLDTLGELSHNFTFFTNTLSRIYQGMELLSEPSQERIFPQVISEKNDTITFEEPSISFDHVSFSYTKIDPLFHDVSLIIPPFQKVGIVGKSGSGKSTFVKLLLGIILPQEGNIFLGSLNIKDVPSWSIQNYITFIPQEPFLFARSIYENIAYAKPDASYDEIINAAIDAQIHSFITQLPRQYNTKISPQGLNLSGGQRQRISLSRAFLKKSPVIILDEPTSALDNTTSALIEETLEKLTVDKTFLFISHKIASLEKMDRILVFDHGRIVEDGSPSELKNLGGLYHFMQTL